MKFILTSFICVSLFITFLFKLSQMAEKVVHPSQNDAAFQRMLKDPAFLTLDAQQQKRVINIIYNIVENKPKLNNQKYNKFFRNKVLTQRFFRY